MTERRVVTLADSVAIDRIDGIDSQEITVDRIETFGRFDILHTPDGKEIKISPYWIKSIRPIGEYQ